MDAVGALVDQLDVTDTAAEAADQAPHAPAPVPAAAAAVKADATKIAAAKVSKQAAVKDARAAGKSTKQHAAVYSRQGKQPAEQADHNAQAKAGSGRQLAVAARGEAAAGEAAEVTDGPSSTNSRPSRPRTKSQPYWMSGAAKPEQDSPSVPAASDAVLESGGHDSWPDQQSHGDFAKSDKAGAKDKKPVMTKRQARSSPQKEQQQPTKKSRADKKQQLEEQLEVHLEADAAAEQEAQAGVGRVAKQQSNARDDRTVRQGGKAAQQEAEEQAQMADDAFAFDTADATVEMASQKEVQQQHDVHMDIEVTYIVL